MPANPTTRELRIDSMHASIGDKGILRGLTLRIRPGETHAIMGPNGSGKSTLCNALIGSPELRVSGHASMDGEDLLGLDIEERAKKGLFLSYQNPIAIPGVNVANYLRTIYNAARAPAPPTSIPEFAKIVSKEMKALHMDESFLDRYLNDGFSGGEKKRCEILQLALLRPQYVLLDEIDSGLDVDALRIISRDLLRLQKERNFGILVITHYARILQYLKPDFVHVMQGGRIAQSGPASLATQIEKSGYGEEKERERR